MALLQEIKEGEFCTGRQKPNQHYDKNKSCIYSFIYQPNVTRFQFIGTNMKRIQNHIKQTEVISYFQ